MKIKKPKFRFPRINFKNESLKIKKPSINFRTIFVIAKREILNHFSSPLAFIILGLFIIIIAIIFFGVYQFLQFGTNDMTQMFTAVAFAFIIIIPALTMGSISKEKQSGTIEFALTQPLTELEFLFGKFLSNAFILFLSLLLTIPLVIIVGILAPLDLGQIAMQYVGAFILGLCFISIGIAVSSLFKSEITSLLIAIVVSILFIVTGSQLLSFVPLQLQSIIERLSLLSHYQSISRGVVDIRDIFYFVAFISVFFAIAYHTLARNKYPLKHPTLLRSRLMLISILVISILIGILGQVIPGRLDFTSNQKYTLSSESKNLINTLGDVLNIKFFASSNLPTEFQSIKRDVEDILRDYSLASNGQINVTQYDPQTDNVAKEDALNQGLQELVFAVDSSDSSQRVTGFLGLTLQYKERNEYLNVTNSVTQDLEYQLSKLIKKVSTEDKIDVGFVTNNVSQSLRSTYTIYNSQLSDLYDVVDLTLTKDSPEIPENIKVVIIAGPSSKFDQEVIENLKKFYEEGGSIFLMSDTIEVSNETGVPAINESSLADLFAEYGVTLDQNFVYDLNQNNPLGVSSGSFVIPVPYPLWFIANSTESTNSVLKNVSNISVLWGGSISVDESKLKETKLYKLFETTDASNVQTGDNIQLSLNQNLDYREDDSKRLIAIALENTKGGRAVIIGDSDYLSDQIIQELNARQQGLDSLNMAFAVGAVEWASKDNQLSAIQARNRLPTRIVIQDKGKALLIGIGTVLPIGLIVLTGSIIFYKRNKLVKKAYEGATQ